MTNSSEQQHLGTDSRGGIFQSILGALASSKLATSVGGLIVLACILGTLLPQGGDVEKYLKVHPDSTGLMNFLGSLRLTGVFEAWWFILLLVFFSLNVAACLIRRLAARLRSGGFGISGWGFLLTHISILLILGGAVIRGAVGEKGELEIQEGQTMSEFLTPYGPVKMPFDVRLVKFELEFYEDKTVENPPGNEPDTLSLAWPDRHIQTQLVVEVGVPIVIHPPDEEPTTSNAIQVVVSQYVPDFVVDTANHEVSTRSEDPKNPAILVNIEGPGLHISKWIFANHPGFDMMHASSSQETAPQIIMRYHSASGARLQGSQQRSRRIRSFKSTLQLLEGKNVVREKTIEVNSPIGYRGYTLYQSGYNPRDLTWSTLQVVRDPGVPLVYTGFLAMIAGLILLLCFKPVARTPSPEGRRGDPEVYHYDAAI